MEVSLEEIAESLKLMGVDAARDRLNLFKTEKLISDFQYLKLLHMVNGGDPEVTKGWKLRSDIQEEKQPVTFWDRLKKSLTGE